MKLTSQIRRLTLIVELLKRSTYPTKVDILDYLNEEMQFEIENNEDLKEKKNKAKATANSNQPETRTGISIRNVERDIKALKDNGFVIERHPEKFGYYIEEVTQKGEAYSRMLDSLHISQVFAAGDVIQLEKVGATGYQYLYSMMDAINNYKVIEFYYQKFSDENADLRKLAPFFIKEFKRRLYVVGKDYKDKKVKTFAFDRMTGAFVTSELFRVDKDYLSEFDNCFGIVNDFEMKSELIRLKAYDNKVNYLETLPLHKSQNIVERGINYAIFELNVKPTYDLIQEILSHAHQLEVLEPQVLIDEVKWRLEETLQFYKKA